MTDEIKNLEGFDENISLIDLANVDLTEISEVRFSILPVGNFDFKLTDAKLAAIEVKGANRVAVKFDSEVTNCHALTDGELQPENFIGKKYNWAVVKKTDETIEEFFGRVKAQLVDIGLVGKGALQALLDEAIGMNYNASIVHAKDKNDPEKIYANLRFPAKKKTAAA